MSAKGPNSYERLVALGKQCAVNITGDPDDADGITNAEEAIKAIRTELKLGRDAHNRLNEIRGVLDRK